MNSWSDNTFPQFRNFGRIALPHAIVNEKKSIYTIRKKKTGWEVVVFTFIGANHCISCCVFTESKIPRSENVSFESTLRVCKAHLRKAIAITVFTHFERHCVNSPIGNKLITGDHGHDTGGA